MTGGKTRGFIGRPGDAESWVRKADRQSAPKADRYTARLTIDITPDLRGRIKIAAFRRGLTVAEILRSLLEREFAEGAAGNDGSAP